MDSPRLEETSRGYTVYAEGRYLYSSRDPSGRAERIAASVPVYERCVYFVPSPLLGYGLATLSGLIPESSIIIAIESSQELMALCTPQIPGDLLTNSCIRWARLSDRQSLHKLLKELGSWRFRKVHRVDLTAGAILNKELYSDLYAFLSESLVVYWRNRHALGRLGRDWIRHALANISQLDKKEIDFRSLTCRKDPRVAVVVGAGPSLEYAIEFLQENRKDLNILCADTALASLTAAGIKADAIIALETQAWNMLDFHGLAESGMPIYADITSYPPSLSATSGPVYLFSSQFAELNFLERLDKAGLRPTVIPPLGSVGLSALEIALITTSGPIILTGLDFSYSPGKSHARESSVHRWQLANTCRIDRYPGWHASMRRPRMAMLRSDGVKVYTDSVLAGYAAQLADRYSASDRIFVLSPGGLDLGLPVITPDQSLELIDNCAEHGVSPADSQISCSESPSGISADTAGRFLSEEKEKLQAVIELWTDYANGNAESSDVASSLKNLDEIFCDFPDEPPLPRIDDSFLVRAVSRTRKLLTYLQRQE